MENMVDLNALVAKARAEIDDADATTCPVLLGGELVDVSVRPIAGQAWADLTAVHPPREGSTQDANVGFNSDAVARDYPVSHILVDGAPIKAKRSEGDPEDLVTWPDIVAVLPSPSIKLLALALWGINQYDWQKRINELGKARAGALRKKRSSPAS